MSEVEVHVDKLSKREKQNSLHPRRRKQTNKAGLKKKKVKVAKEKQHVSSSTITTKQPLFQTCLKN